MFLIFDPYLVTKCKLMNLFSKGEQHPFLYKLSYPIYYLIQFHLLWNPISPLPEANLLTPVLLWEGTSHTQFCMENSLGTVGSSWVWTVGSKSTQEQSVSVIHLESLFNVWLVHSIISELWAYMQHAVSIWWSFAYLLYGFSSGHVWMLRVGLWRKLSTEESMLLNCGVGEHSWESLGLQGDPTSPFWRRSALGFLWKEWC